MLCSLLLLLLLLLQAVDKSYAMYRQLIGGKPVTKVSDSLTTACLTMHSVTCDVC
jgi:hypothetical protein